MNPTKRAYLELHIAVILYGFTAILGNLINLTAFMIVWWRVLLASISFLFLIKVLDKLRSLPNKVIVRFALIGVLVALHWVCFYGSIKYANSSVALVCMATTSFFTSLIEPVITRSKFDPLQIGSGLMIIPGMFLIVNNLEVGMLFGVWVGLMAAFLAALFATFNKKYIKDSDPNTISFIELGSAWIFSAFASNLVINLEPVYGIILAIFILKEHKDLNPNFYLGVGIIIMVVFIYPFLSKRMKSNCLFLILTN